MLAILYSGKGTGGSPTHMNDRHFAYAMKKPDAVSHNMDGAMRMDGRGFLIL